MNPYLARIVVLVSGNGSNLQALIDACGSGTLSAQIVAVISNKPDAYALERAKKAGIPVEVVVKRKEQERSEYDQILAERVGAFQPDVVVLAGWMRMLSAAFLGCFPLRVVNLHPALPGKFPGMHAIAEAFEAFRSGTIAETGVMVHLVPDEGMDNGPVLGQVSVPILAEDTLDTLEVRIHAAEHRLLVDTLRQYLVQMMSQ